MLIKNCICKLCYVWNLLQINFVTYKSWNNNLLHSSQEISRRCLSGTWNTLSNQYVCTVQCTVYVKVSVLCTNLPQILCLLFYLTIYIPLYNLWWQCYKKCFFYGNNFFSTNNNKWVTKLALFATVKELM